MMATSARLWCLVLVATCASPFAKSAEDYYHAASYQYVEGKIQEASLEAEEGLRLNPGDEKLNALAQHLRKMKDQQRGNQGQNQQDKNKQDGKNPGDKKQDKGENGDKDKNKEGDKGDQKGDKDKDKPDNGKDGEEPGKQGKGEGEGEPKAPKMSEAEAKRLLNSFADDEKKEQAERRKVIRSRAGTEQDW